MKTSEQKTELAMHNDDAMCTLKQEKKTTTTFYLKYLNWKQKENYELLNV